jgi:hypothetical protein
MCEAKEADNNKGAFGIGTKVGGREREGGRGGRGGTSE